MAEMQNNKTRVLALVPQTPLTPLIQTLVIFLVLCCMYPTFSRNVIIMLLSVSRILSVFVINKRSKKYSKYNMHIIATVLCPHLWSNKVSTISKLFHFNCYHAYAYAFHMHFFCKKHFHVSQSM